MRWRSERSTRYIPALDFDWLTPLYDPLIRLTMPERRFKSRLIERARIADGMRVLDLGCGTGTLTMMVKHRYPRAHVVGLDGDPKILAIARQKAEKEGITLTFEGAMAFDLPYAEGSFDRVLSSLVFHHLTREDKRRTFAECFRVLRPGAELHIADWGRPHNLLMWLASWSVRLFDGPKTTTDNLHGRLTELCRGAGFVDVVEGDRFATIFGTLSMYTAQKPQ